MFASDDSPANAFENPFDRGQINIADVFSQPSAVYSSVEMAVSAVETSLQALFKEFLEQYKDMSSANEQGSKNRPPSGHLRLKNPVWHGE